MYKIELISGVHQVDTFDSGIESKNTFLRKFALQNSKGGLGRTYVAVEPSEPTKVCGYFTISSSTVRFENLHYEHLPRYPIPSILIGKLAVEKGSQKQGLGIALLFDALKRAANAAQEIGIFLVEVKALDEDAKNFYIKFGFIEMLDVPLKLYMNLKTVRQLLKNLESRP